MVTLTDKQIEHILAVTRPLQPQERGMFQAALLEALIQRRDELGDGALGRLLRELQRKHFQPPVSTEDWRLESRGRGLEHRVVRK